MNWPKRGFTLVETVSLVLASTQAGCANGVAQSMAAQLDQTVSTDELDQLVAPIALYPDDLLRR